MSQSLTTQVTISPMDVHNQRLVSNVHPQDWVNPKPANSYNLVVIGAGTAGLVTAAGAASLGAKVTLIEKHLMGGDCLNVGCVPSKTIIRSSRVYADIRDAQQFGIRVPEGTTVNFSAVMERMRRLRAGISPHDSAKRFQQLGVDVFLGKAHFCGADTVEVQGKRLRFKKAVIATGARATPPSIPGLAEAGYLTKVERRNDAKIIYYSANGQLGSVVVDEILVGAGRSPNLEGLNLEAVGVEYDTRKGVMVNDRLQTTNPRIYAAGDVCMEWKFTHAADAAARIVIQNSLFLGRKKLSALTMPWCTYTGPEIAHVGLYETQAQKRGIDVNTFFVPFSQVDRAIADGEENGFAKVHVKKGTDKILGATIVARHAGDMIGEITLAMVGNLGLGTIATVIHPYPTQAEAIRKAADAYNRTCLTPFVKQLFSRWAAWTL